MEILAVNGIDISWLPSLGSSAAAVVVVWFFLKHLASERKTLVDERATHEKHANERSSKIATCVDRNSDVIDKNTEVLGYTLEVLRKYNGVGK